MVEAQESAEGSEDAPKRRRRQRKKEEPTLPPLKVPASAQNLRQELQEAEEHPEERKNGGRRRRRRDANSSAPQHTEVEGPQNSKEERAEGLRGSKLEVKEEVLSAGELKTNTADELRIDGSEKWRRNREELNFAAAKAPSAAPAYGPSAEGIGRIEGAQDLSAEGTEGDSAEDINVPRSRAARTGNAIDGEATDQMVTGVANRAKDESVKALQHRGRKSTGRPVKELGAGGDDGLSEEESDDLRAEPKKGQSNDANKGVTAEVSIPVESPRQVESIPNEDRGAEVQSYTDLNPNSGPQHLF